MVSSPSKPARRRPSAARNPASDAPTTTARSVTAPTLRLFLRDVPHHRGVDHAKTLEARWRVSTGQVRLVQPCRLMNVADWLTARIPGQWGVAGVEVFFE